MSGTRRKSTDGSSKKSKRKGTPFPKQKKDSNNKLQSSSSSKKKEERKKIAKNLNTVMEAALGDESDLEGGSDLEEENEEEKNLEAKNKLTQDKQSKKRSHGRQEKEEEGAESIPDLKETKETKSKKGINEETEEKEETKEEDDDDAPEAISLSTSKNEANERRTMERKARQIVAQETVDRRKNRQLQGKLPTLEMAEKDNDDLELPPLDPEVLDKADQQIPQEDEEALGTDGLEASEEELQLPFAGNRSKPILPFTIEKDNFTLVYSPMETKTKEKLVLAYASIPQDLLTFKDNALYNGKRIKRAPLHQVRKNISIPFFSKKQKQKQKQLSKTIMTNQANRKRLKTE